MFSIPSEPRKPGLAVSLLPLLLMGLFLGIGYGVLQIRAEILLVTTAAVSGVIAALHGYSWKTLQEGIVESVAQAMPAMLIVLCVGLLIGAWIAAGTIPMLIYYGLKIISPGFFLVTACVVSSLVSLFTGTSYGTVGTMGIALIGIAQGLDIPLAPAAGAIISGAYFGDKLSPFSDTTNLAPVAARSNLFDHIRHMLWTTLPAWVLALAFYTVIGLSYRQNVLPASEMTLLLETLRSAFHFHWMLLLPPAVVLFFAVKKWPTIPGMVLASFLGAAFALIFQKSGLKPVLNAMSNGYVADTGLQTLDTLLSRGGMMSMMGVTLIAFCAFAFAGIVKKSGMLQVILDHLLQVVKSTGSLIAATAGSSAIMAFMTGSSFLTILVPGELFAPAYRQRKLAAKNLSRTTEDCGTVIVPLVPWSMAGIYMSGTLGVSVAEYAPWAVFCYTGIVFALIYGFTGIGIAPRIKEDETEAGA